MIPRSPPAGLGARGLQRGLRRVRGRRPADVLRPRCRRRARPRRRCSATWSPWPATGSPAPAAPASRRTPTGRCCRWGRPAPATTWRSTSTTAPACSPRSPRPSPSTASRSRPCARRAAAPTPSWSWSRTRPPTPQLSATVEHLRGMDIVREVTSVMRVEGERGMTARPRPHPPVARRHRGVPRPARHPRRAPRRSPCARAARRWSTPSGSPASPAPRSGSRSRATTRPAPSRTAG